MKHKYNFLSTNHQASPSLPPAPLPPPHLFYSFDRHAFVFDLFESFSAFRFLTPFPFCSVIYLLFFFTCCISISTWLQFCAIPFSCASPFLIAFSFYSLFFGIVSSFCLFFRVGIHGAKTDWAYALGNVFFLLSPLFLYTGKGGFFPLHLVFDPTKSPILDRDE